MLNLDDLDFRIIKELGGSFPPLWNVRESYSKVSRKLGVDEETVRLRVNRAKECGFLPVWQMMANPLLFNYHEANLNLEVREEQHKADAISKIKLVDGVLNIVDFRGKDLAVHLYYSDNDDALAAKVSQIESICGSPKLVLWERKFPTPNIQMKQLDWRIIEAMHEDAWRDLDEVAKSLGVSSRTVQRRLSAMIEGRAVYLLRPPNADVVSGLMCNFLVFFSNVDKKRAADYVIHSTFARIGASDTSPELFSMVGISCENFAEADKVMERMKANEGVTSVRMRIMKEVIIVQDWLKSEIDKRIAMN
jgi:DNA-binding Lrp family transcriptional regulator